MKTHQEERTSLNICHHYKKNFQSQYDFLEYGGVASLKIVGVVG